MLIFGNSIVASRVCLAVLMLASGMPAAAGEYTPPGLYEVDYYRLANGLRVLLKERHAARSVAYRVIVDVGQADYPCGRKETPHFLEHLLFNGTSSHTESELDDLVEQHGGSWNAYTGQESTDYHLDIFSLYAPLGLEILHEIMTDSRIAQEDVDRSRDIIHREAGGTPTAFERWLHENGLGRSGSELAHDRLVLGTPFVCDGLETAENISRADVLQAYEQNYVGSNMALIVVGDFETGAMKAMIASTFGTIPAGKSRQREFPDPEPVTEKLVMSSSLSPLVDSEAFVGVAYASGGSRSPDYYPRWFIEKYLSDRLFKRLRLEAGLSYSASADTASYSNVDVWYAYADTELDTIDEVVALIQEEIEKLADEPVTDDALALVKSKLLMSIARGFESNGSMANYYTASFHEIEKYGALIREEDRIDALTAEDIQRVAKTIFAERPPVIFHDKPTFTYTQLAISIGGFALLVSLVAFRYINGKRARDV